jgi:2-oxoisovalerate dehydrogenase E1 component
MNSSSAIPLNLLDSYRVMTTIRRFEERCLQLSHDGVVAGSVHLCLGQEAIPVGALAALGEADRVLPTYRGHGWAIACGVPVEDLLAEICHRAGGVNGGRGGSAHLSAPAYRLLGENSIVGAGVPIAAGVAMAASRLETGGVAIASIGDGAMNQGSVHEGMVFAAANKLPLVIVCENNGWAEMTPSAMTSFTENFADRAAPYGISATVVDGNDPAAVHTAVAAAVARARAGEGPSLIEAKTARLSGHYTRDIQHYRPKDEAERAQARDPLPRLRQSLLENGVAADELDSIEAEVARDIEAATERVLAMPEPDPATAREHVVARPGPLPAVTAADAAAPHEMTYWKAINTALGEELFARPELLVYGEDVGAGGGIFGVTRSLQKQFGARRVFDTPIAESAILGSAVGASLAGARPVVEIMWGDFLWVAFDQIINQASNVRYVSRGALNAPMTVRLQQGATPGSCAQHSQSMEAILAHVPGIKVGAPATPDDAYAMTRAAIADPDPVILIEARELYLNKGDVRTGAAPEPVGGARFRRSGDALAIITWGPMVLRALAAAETLASQGIEVTVLDLRWLNPIDDEAIAQAVRQGGGRVLVVHEANRTGGLGAEIAARIAETHLDKLDAPVARLATPDTRIPAAPALQQGLIPGADAIVAAAQELVGIAAAAAS